MSLATGGTTIFGYGSLMSAQSAAKTMDVANLRAGILFDYRRTSNLVSISSIKAGTADLETLECAALSIAPSSSSSGKDSVCGCLFEITEKDLGPYIEREHRYAVEEVDVYDITSKNTRKALTVVARTDEAYRAIMDDREYYQRVGQYYDGSLWGRTDVLPLRTYTNNAILAAQELGGNAWVENFLDQTFLGDGSTTIREYYEQYPERMFPEVKRLLNMTPKKETKPVDKREVQS